MLKQIQDAMTMPTGAKRKEGGLGESFRSILQVVVIALAFRILLFQAFSIPSGSMKATLLVGDYLFVSQYSYGWSHYSLPFSPPLFSGRIFGSEPKRGDVVVFRLPKDDSIDYIKRVIGLHAHRPVVPFWHLSPRRDLVAPGTHARNCTRDLVAGPAVAFT